MFNYTLDQKPIITDNKGNKIVDLAKGIFSRDAGTINQYTKTKVNTHSVMRADLVSLGSYGTTEYAEFILKYTGISNPFVLDYDDVLMIPNPEEASGKMWVNNPDIIDEDKDVRAAAIRNYYKFVNQDYKSDKSSYDALANTKFESAIPTSEPESEYTIPYISDSDRTAVTIRNGRIFFGENSGVDSGAMVSASTTNLDEKIQGLIDSTASALSDANCVYNGVSLADFIRASAKSNGEDALRDAQQRVLNGKNI